MTFRSSDPIIEPVLADRPTIRVGSHLLVGPDEGKLAWLASEIFHNQVYNCAVPPPRGQARSEVVDLRRAILSILPADLVFDPGYRPSSAPVIIDAGANVGTATSWFLQRYPEAQVIAVEPNPEAFAFLAHNLKMMAPTRTLAVNAALCGRGAHTVRLYSSASEASLRTSIWEHRNSWTRAFEVPAVSLLDLLERTGPAFLLKLDIEGSEEEVLEELAREGKLGSFRAVLTEWHHYVDLSGESLARALLAFRRAGARYSLRATPPVDGFQDIMIEAFWPDMSE
ncbi:FkbM family methyltransferase [Dactylosporangium roseum]|uniref:FkbM family methyltransferase n=1 Tax=Dactylosporangium roseum TaxID=47989 RepID=A0ABY5Z510_9ACTN|nr:FkbM family methyltransferase [Dactylosporangium roseum]UWZ36562.1 FkbM family methyltransferase [Dactylosporangium roseum]